MTAAGLTLPDTIQGFLSQQERLVRAGQGQRLDFTMDYLHYLCLKDIADCKLLLDSLDSDSKRKIDKSQDKKLFGLIPRYAYLVPLVPFFPIMFLFTGSGGLAFFITAGSEMFLRLLWPDFSTDLLGKMWISLTFFIFTPSLLYLLYRIVDTLLAGI